MTLSFHKGKTVLVAAWTYFDNTARVVGVTASLVLVDDAAWDSADNVPPPRSWVCLRTRFMPISVCPSRAMLLAQSINQHLETILAVTHMGDLLCLQMQKRNS